MKFNPNDDKITLPDSSEDEEKSMSSESEEEQFVSDPFQQDLSDSDSAPEILSFKSAREGTRLEKKHAAEVIKTSKDERKRKRNEVHLQNMLQKEEKKRKIESKRLPDEILQDLDKLPSDSATVPSVQESPEPEITEDVDMIEEEGPTMFVCKILPHESKRRHVPVKVASFKERALYGGRIRREKSTRECILKSAKQLVRTQKHCT